MVNPCRKKDERDNKPNCTVELVTAYIAVLCIGIHKFRWTTGIAVRHGDLEKSFYAKVIKKRL